MNAATPLICPTCRGPLVAAGELLRHPEGDCREDFPVIDSIARVVTSPALRRRIAARHASFGPGAESAALRDRWAVAGSAASSLYDRVVADFDDEWSSFSEVGTPELARIFEQYFDLVPSVSFAPERVVLDAGCGAGRWAYEVARRGPRVVAVDLGLSVEAAARSCAPTGRVDCVEGDLLELPLADASVDWAYTLGVVHHLADPLRALCMVVRAVRPGGMVLVYVYHSLEGRSLARRGIFRGIDLVRRALSRLPRRGTRAAASVIALLVYLPLARLSALLASLGLGRLAEALPLSFYRHRSLRIMRNDALDRFGTRVEHRYRRDELEALMRDAGLEDIRFSDGPPYWHAIGSRPAGA